MGAENPKTIKYAPWEIETMGKPGRKKAKEYDVVIEQDENGVYVAHVPELPGCHTQGNSIEEVTKNASEAIELYLEHTKNRVENPMKFIGVKKVPAAASA
jgi:predicted RNase H-like HicB family nuclease